MNTFSKISLLMVTLLIAVTLQAQENVPQIKRHDFRIDIGAKITSPGYSFYHDCSQIDAPTTLPENMQYTYIPTSPSINLSYYYQFKKWFAFGFTGTYARGGEYREGLITNRLYSSTIWNQFAVTPRVRFDWFRNNIVNCYSSVGIGVSYVYESRKTNYEQSYTNDSYYWITYDATFFGLTVGKSLYGFMEVGLSSIGFGKIGLGYRF